MQYHEIWLDQVMWREKVICPHCGRETPKAQFCKFCGKPLTEEKLEEVVSEIEAQAEKVKQEAPEEVEKKPHEISEERKIVEQLANYLNWRHKLLELFLGGEASAEVFLDLYKEYQGKIRSINSRRLELINSLEQKLNELTTRLEQLRVRHEIGEISDKQYITEKLAIDREISKIRPRIDVLRNFLDVKLSDIPAYEERIRSLRERILEKGSSLGLSDEDISMITGDLNETLDALKDLMKIYEKLKRELDKIELRYKIGELSEEEYQAAKQKIERQMQLS
jgi:DNA repair exonuclease SbcCD ATPase subunit